MKSKELVLGGEGLIGRELTEALRGAGHEVVSLDLKTGTDLRRATIEPFVACDRVWFLAWDTGGAKYHSTANLQHEMYRNNCEIAASVFECLERTKRPFVFVTSQLAGQASAYGRTKLMAETWAAQLGGKVARLWNTYGWEQPDVKSHVVTDLVLAGLTEGAVRTLTRGEERRRFIYKTDCVDALRRFFDGSRATVDIAGDRWIAVRELAEVIAGQLGVPVTFGSQPGMEAMIDPVEPLADWRPTISLEDGIARVIADAKAYLKQNAQKGKTE